MALTTVGAYTLFTVLITQWRTRFRKDMVRIENEASGKAVDSLLNYETVRWVGGFVCFFGLGSVERADRTPGVPSNAS